MVLEVESLTKTYKTPFRRKKVRALENVSFKIAPGKITGFLGPNGAGKTTTLKCLLELAFPDSGKVSWFGKGALVPELRAKLGFLPERPYFYEHLTGREFLRFYAQLSGRVSNSDLSQRVQEQLERVQLGHAADRPLRSYSKGMLQRAGIAQALIHRPEFVILDEPMTGLDPDGRFEVRQIISEAAEQGTAVFFSSHLLNDAQSLCEDLVILKKGQLIYNGSTQNLLNQIQPKWKLHYQKENTRDSLEYDSQVDANRELDRLRKAGYSIIEFAPVRPNLEEIFVKMAFDKAAP